MSYAGLGTDPVACDVGEEWDWNAMACVTAGQAVTPSPQLPQNVPVPLPKPVPQGQPAPGPGSAPVVQQASALEQAAPWLLGGAVLLGVLALALSSRRASPNPRRKRRSRSPKCPSGMKAQTLVFPKSRFTKAQAKAWAKKHGFRSSKVDAKGPSYRLRQAAPSSYRKGMFRTISMGPDVKAVVACPK